MPFISNITSLRGVAGRRGPQGDPGPEGPAGTPGAPGGSDASFAGWVDDQTPSLTRKAVLGARKKAAHDEVMDRSRALRTFHGALKNSATAAVDVLVGPGDSIAEGAALSGTATTGWPLTYPRVLQSRLRRAFQPAGVDGGDGYMGIGGPVFFSGTVAFTSSTGLVVRNDVGLGRKAIQAPVGDALVVETGTHTGVWILFTKDSSSGSISYTVDGGAATVVSANNATLTHDKIAITGLDPSKNHEIVLTVTDNPVTFEGIQFFRGDETTGIRVWEAAHSSYSANDFATSTEWANSLPLIPNVKLVILSIGLNDQYFGRTPAQMKTSIESLISLIRTKTGGTPSFALISYFSRNVDPPTGAPNPWSDYVAKYQEIADADPDVTVIDIAPMFDPAPGVSNDTRGGLLSSSDYTHPTPAGYEIIGDYIASQLLPAGRTSDGYLPISDQVKALAKDYGGEGGDFYALGNFSGNISFGSLPRQSYSMTLTGNAVIQAANMPPVPAGKTASILVKFTQDATGGRTVTTTLAGTQYLGLGPIVDPRANASTLVKLIWDGAAWWIRPLRAYNSRTVVLTGLTGTLNFAGYWPAINTTFQLTLSGNVTIASNLMPPASADQEFRFRCVMKQDATGGRTLTLSGFKRAGGAFPALSTAANAQDLIEFHWDGTSWWAIPVAMNGS